MVTCHTFALGAQICLYLHNIVHFIESYIHRNRSHPNTNIQYNYIMLTQSSINKKEKQSENFQRDTQICRDRELIVLSNDQLLLEQYI